MRRALSILGGLFLFLCVVVVSFLGFAAHQGKGLDQSSKAYVEETVPVILSTWSKDELIKRASPQLLSAVRDQPELLDQLFQKLSGLGALRTFDDVRGDSNISYTTREGKVITAAYTAKAKFDEGDAQISIRLIQTPAGWQLLSFHVNSPIFVQ